MSASQAVPVFLAAALISLGMSWILVSSLERVGERLGLSEALLGVVAALAADAPEITAAVTALVHHEPRVGAGVVIGSNVFNLATLLGLGAVLAGRINLHRRVIALGGAVAVWVAAVCLAAVLGLISALAGLLITVAALGLYLFVLAEGPRKLRRLPLPPRWTSWLSSAVREEELELVVAIRPQRGRPRDAAVAAGSLLLVIGASAAMERAAVVLGGRYGVPPLVVGGLVLAAITSLPNAVAANYLAAKGRGAATLSTALTSNNLNVVVGFLLPATIVGLQPPSGRTTLLAGWYLGLTALVLAWAYRDHSLRRVAGAVVIVAYLVFVGLLLATTGAL